MYDTSKLVSDEVFNYLLEVLPNPKQARRGRKRVEKKALLSGIIQVLRLGIPWYQIFDCGCSYSSCFRYFKEIQRRGAFHLIQEELARTKTDIAECAIDTTTVTSFRFSDMTGWDGKHRKVGTKVSIISDINGLRCTPLSRQQDCSFKILFSSPFKINLGWGFVPQTAV